MPSAPMRILYMIDEMETITAGGTERQVLQMVRLMKAAGADVRLCTLRGTEWLTAEIAGCHVEHFQVNSFWRFSGLAESARLARWMRGEKIQILQTFFVEANIIGPLVGRMAAVPIILGSRRNLNYWMKPTTALLQKMANRFATRLVANCAAVRDHVAKTEGISQDKIEVIYNGLDVNRLAPDPEIRRKTRAAHGLPDGDVVIGAVSALRPIKGCEIFIDAAKEVLRHVPNARFVLVGDGPLRRELEIRAASMGTNFRFVGAQEDIRPFLNMFDIAVLSSESEGFSNSILEYMAAGLPSVVTDTGGNREAIENTGLVIPPRSASDLTKALVGLIRDPGQRAAFSARALERAKDFDLDSTQATLVDYYNRLLGAL